MDGPDERAPEADAGQSETRGGRAHRPADLPPDPEAYDHPRSELARLRGLDAPYIAGGSDPEPDEGLRQERLYGRLLVLMVVVIVGLTVILTIVAIALGGFGYSGR